MFKLILTYCFLYAFLLFCVNLSLILFGLLFPHNLAMVDTKDSACLGECSVSLQHKSCHKYLLKKIFSSLFHVSLIIYLANERNFNLILIAIFTVSKKLCLVGCFNEYCLASMTYDHCLCEYH